MVERNILIAPSILSANFADLQSDIRRAETAGAKVLHLDVMDGTLRPEYHVRPRTRPHDQFRNIPDA
jgi:pentose-5-phosphate-3-epimerase